jgi:pyridoxal phosphate enzyme (YggS family)
MPVGENVAIVEERIQKACDCAGRKRDEITLMGVSKFVPIEDVKEAFNAGIRCFGESRVKEGTEKFEYFRDEHPEVQFHLIGSLQRNKTKPAILFFDCIQSVDRIELIDELAKYVHLKGKPLEVLLEMHTGEETKRGFTEIDGLCRAAELILGKVNLKPAGLMTMAPFTEDKEKIRASFRQLVKARNELEKRFPPKENWSCLSMGMSNDFEIAVEEGATMLRIGSLIFR